MSSCPQMRNTACMVYAAVLGVNLCSCHKILLGEGKRQRSILTFKRYILQGGKDQKNFILARSKLCSYFWCDRFFGSIDPQFSVFGRHLDIKRMQMLQKIEDVQISNSSRLLSEPAARVPGKAPLAFHRRMSIRAA